eukprot:CAMPEP_0171323264 /NCGR_PEP_ID=MMETSP0816-20121228/115468_1 /TAXON_ID=420281 /ORGANISM="Proboscia inermis, Strain CCAP1064/1" /LENGTH=776 /DNA_ID=CAMNT_0011821937 /DNA_START=639 /DNA_END=2970 /DNA_ORIENTATION=+
MGLIHGISTLKNGTDTSMEQWHQIRRHLSGERVGSTTKSSSWDRIPRYVTTAGNEVGNQIPIVQLHPMMGNDVKRRGEPNPHRAITSRYGERGETAWGWDGERNPHRAIISHDGGNNCAWMGWGIDIGPRTNVTSACVAQAVRSCELRTVSTSLVVISSVTAAANRPFFDGGCVPQTTAKHRLELQPGIERILVVPVAQIATRVPPVEHLSLHPQRLPNQTPYHLPYVMEPKKHPPSLEMALTNAPLVDRVHRWDTNPPNPHVPAASDHLRSRAVVLHCHSSNTNETTSDGDISAAPIVAVIDSVAADGRVWYRVPNGRYATLAAVVSGRYWGDANSTDWDTKPSLTLYGIGRAASHTSSPGTNSHLQPRHVDAYKYDGGQTANPTSTTASVSAGDTGSLPTTVSDPNNLFPSLGFSMEPKINKISGIERIRQLDNYGLQTYAYQTSIQTLTHDLSVTATAVTDRFDIGCVPQTTAKHRLELQPGIERILVVPVAQIATRVQPVEHLSLHLQRSATISCFVKFSRSSPVHAIAELHYIYNCVTRMHIERQKLVKGLRMAKIRLENREALNDEESDFRDYVFDGFGVSDEIKGSKASPTSTNASISAGDTGSLPTTVSDPNNLFPSLGFSMEPPTTVSDPNNLFPSLGFSMEPKINEISGIERIRQLDNYGLQTYAYQTFIQTLTHDLIEKLTPFYSPTYTTREEFFYEKASFVTLRALEPYVTPKQVAKSLIGTSSLTRLKMGYELMLEHRLLLEELAREMSDALLECGEECTDLW